MKRLRITYLIIIPVIIATGLLVRIKQVWFPAVVNLYLGDALYAVMVFYIYSFVLPFKSGIIRAGYALITCYCIEFLQLSSAPCIVAARATLPGRLVLGQGFLWSDLLAYSMGIAAAYVADRIWLSHTGNV